MCIYKPSATIPIITCRYTYQQHFNAMTSCSPSFLIWMFPKIVGFPPKSSILIGFSIIFTIHFGVPLFLETPISHTWCVKRFLFLTGFCQYVFFFDDRGKVLPSEGGRVSLPSPPPKKKACCLYLGQVVFFCKIIPIWGNDSI